MNILVYGDKQVNTTKIVIATVAVAALALVAVGLASAQLQANQTYTGTAPSNGGFFGWIGNCFGLGGNQPYGIQYVAPQGPTGTTAPEPYATYQGGYYGNGYGYGYGSYMRGFYP
jgi:hypothetical protein